MVIGCAKTATTAAKAPAPPATRSITAATAVPATMTTKCATIAATALRIAVSATKNAAAAMKPAVMSAMCAVKNVRSALILSATIAAFAPNVQAMNCTAPSVCCVSAVRIGSVTAVRAARNAPPAAKNAMKNA